MTDKLYRRILLFPLVFLLLINLAMGTSTIHTTAQDGDQLELKIIDLSNYYRLLYENGCVKVYSYSGPLGMEWKDFWGDIFSGKNEYFVGSYQEYTLLMNTIRAILENNSVVTGYWLAGPRIAYPEGDPAPETGFSGLVVYVNANTSEADIQDLYNSLETIMADNNLTVLVVVKEPSFIRYVPTSSLGEAKRSLTSLIASSPGNRPRYLELLDQMGDESGLYTVTVSRSYNNDFNANLLLLSFYEPLPSPSEDDLVEIASWLSGHAGTAGLCGFTIAIADHLEPVKNNSIATETVGNVGDGNQSNHGADMDNSVREGNGSSALYYIVVISLLATISLFALHKKYFD